SSHVEISYAVFCLKKKGHHLNSPVVGIAPTLDGRRYWLVASHGGSLAYVCGISRFGTGFYGSARGRHLGSPVTGMAASADGLGYWLVAGDGGVFTYGDATYHGSVPGQ